MCTVRDWRELTRFTLTRQPEWQLQPNAARAVARCACTQWQRQTNSSQPHFDVLSAFLLYFGYIFELISELSVTSVLTLPIDSNGQSSLLSGNLYTATTTYLKTSVRVHCVNSLRLKAIAAVVRGDSANVCVHDRRSLGTYLCGSPCPWYALRRRPANKSNLYLTLSDTDGL